MKPKAALLVAAIIIFLAVCLAVGSGLIVPPSFDPDTKGYCHENLKGGGQFPNNEMMEDATAFLSWDERGVSEAITVSTTAQKCENALGIWQKFRLVFYVDNGEGWTWAAQDDFPGGLIEWTPPSATVFSADPIALFTRTVRIDGISFQDVKTKAETQILDGAVMRVWLQGFFKPPFGGGGYNNLAKDEIRLTYARPSVERTEAIFEVGETGSFRYEVPFTTLDSDGDGAPETAYTISLTYLGTNAFLPGWENVDIAQKKGLAEFEVTSDLFQPGKVNRVRAEIYSPIFRADVEDVTTIDNKELAPTITKVEFNQREFREGDTVRITLAGEPNPTTKSPIVGFYVLAHIGGTAVYDEFTEGDTITFSATLTGVLEVEASARDAEGRESAIMEVKATVGNVIVDCEVHPELPECQNPLHGLPWMLIIGIILLVVGFILWKAGGNLPVRVAGLLSGIGGLALFVFGLIDLVRSLIGW